MTTETKKETVLERFNTQIKENKTLYWLEKQLAQLLNEEVVGNKWFSEEDKATLAEYKENFDWDLSYWVEFDWEVGSDFTSTEKVENLEELHAYLSGEKEPPTTEDLAEENEYWRDEIETEVYGVTSARPKLSVDNLRLKEKKTNTYSVLLSVETPNESKEVSVDIEDILFKVFCSMKYELKSIQVIEPEKEEK